MPEKETSEIPRALRDLFEKGNAAVQRNNLDYALTIYTDVLKKEPAFLDCRQALRMAQMKKAKKGGGFFKKVMGSANPALAKAQMQAKSKPAEALVAAEQALNSDPTNASAHKLAASASLALELPKTAIMSLEMVVEKFPSDRDAVLDLCRAYTLDQQHDKAETVMSDFITANPKDTEMASKLKNLSASRTLQEGGYDKLAEGGGSYRDILKDKDGSVKMEQEARAHKDEETVQKLLDEAYEKLKQDPSDLQQARKVADLFALAKDYVSAVKYYQMLISINPDPIIEKEISKFQLKIFDQRLEQVDSAAEDADAQRESIEREKAEFLLGDLKAQAAKYPNDMAIRYELGMLCMKAGHHNEAIQEFQKAQRDPHRHLAALRGLGECFAKKGQHDLAAKTIEGAIQEKPGFDTEKKDLIYLLGTIYEQMNKQEQAIEQFKVIYESDIGYRDVAAKVDGYYSSSS